jgi:hypothetical protein
VKIGATAVSREGEIKEVTFLVDDKVAAVVSQPPYVFVWPATRGHHVFVARTTDSAGNHDESKPLIIEVRSK